MTSEPGWRLSAAGAARREAMLPTVRRIVRRRARVRTCVRASCAVAVIAAAAWAGTVIRSSRTNPSPAPEAVQVVTAQPESAPPEAAHPTPSQDRQTRVVELKTDRRLLDRVAVSGSGLRVQRIDDAALLAELSAEGRTAGLIRTPTRVIVTGDVGSTDQGSPRSLRPGEAFATLERDIVRWW